MVDCHFADLWHKCCGTRQSLASYFDIILSVAVAFDDIPDTNADLAPDPGLDLGPDPDPDWDLDLDPTVGDPESPDDNIDVEFCRCDDSAAVVGECNESFFPLYSQIFPSRSP
ncbi:hypothetical protein AX774_g1763 [Zancudomyces culisetae]|uniref:Uncharacterized protein n=1 Tax=Zancudomyces culisetae TaxID=1213189 RepID=A0A1R1PUR7_ZANCU|nr:hypothetical protein AX774_g1763 [Zancudomyces culisetae]|eukprot:OMH84716.1 hypothetical protein AX774_g1763 [Zancudomyces culisetae]